MNTLLRARVVRSTLRLEESKAKLVEAMKFGHVPNPFGEGPIGSTSSGKLVHPYDHEHYSAAHGAKHPEKKLAAVLTHEGFSGWSATDHSEAASKHSAMVSLANEHHETFNSMSWDDLDPEDQAQGSKAEFNTQKKAMLGKLKEMAQHHKDLADVHNRAAIHGALRS